MKDVCNLCDNGKNKRCEELIDRAGNVFTCSRFTGKYPNVRIAPDKSVSRTVPKSKKYGLSPEILQKILIKQSNKCAICDRSEPLKLDHNHLTNKARGYLCQTCNTLISGFDRPIWREKAEKYLDNPPAAEFYT